MKVVKWGLICSHNRIVKDNNVENSVDFVVPVQGVSEENSIISRARDHS